MEYLDAYTQTDWIDENSDLLSKHAGKLGPYGSPWGSKEAKHSPIKTIDNTLWRVVKYGGDTYYLHTLLFGIAVELGKVRVVSLLLSDRYRDEYEPLVDPAYFERGVIDDAVLNENIEVVDLARFSARR